MKNRTSGTSYEIDMTADPLFPKILLFSLPLMLSGMLQLLFNAADVIVVGRFAGESSLAAVGSTGAVSTLLINLFSGLSVGTNVLTAQAIGMKDDDMARKTVHTSILFSLLSGLFLAVIGWFLSRPLLALIDTPDDVIDKATIYLQICFIGMPACMLFNFGYAIMRAIGDTRRPMYYLIFAGIVNVVLNVIFVTQLHMDVAGVALATIISQVISGLLIVRSLSRLENACHLDIKKLRINKKILIRMMKIGIPAGVQGTMFSISNTIIQSSVNYFGKTVMAGNAAAGNVEGFIYIAMNAYHQTALSFTSQNYGANKIERIKKIFWQCILTVSAIGIILSALVLIFSQNILPLYSSEPEVIRYATLRLYYVCTAYFMCGVMDTIVGATRGLGSSVIPMIFSLIWACLYRSIWALTVFEKHKTLGILYISYPISWVMTVIFQLVYFLWFYKRIKERRLG